ncbi:hypothetical protein DPEC_G00320800 [Dallia pectoralis]|uniref:Uncharacterized protein n=1 Tax=Dallia pectoralis TaxID=75939 RepID=A0ACC2F9Z5_DALPE|nr:hypothetical protein DPEC_G00320800 [Dallia pectoralis]
MSDKEPGCNLDFRSEPKGRAAAAKHPSVSGTSFCCLRLGTQMGGGGPSSEMSRPFGSGGCGTCRCGGPIPTVPRQPGKPETRSRNTSDASRPLCSGTDLKAA